MLTLKNMHFFIIFMKTKHVPKQLLFTEFEKIFKLYL